jgi:two-component system, cell cycle sensor histidine kinase DivJ
MSGLSAYFRSLVHDSARDDLLTTARHQYFIATHLLGGLLVLSVFPVYLAVAGQPSWLGAVAFLWLLTPIPLAIFLAKTGRFATAQFVSAANFAGFVTYACWLTGGIQSFLLPWMIVVPLEAALSNDRRAVLWAGGVACLGLAVLVGLSAYGIVTPVDLSFYAPTALALAGAALAAVYAAGLAAMVQHVHQSSEDAVRHGEERYRMLAENTLDMITRHDSRGKVVFASIASQHLLGEPASKLYGEGLFERVHVADRPAYLTALSQSYSDRMAIAVEFRLRRSTYGREGHGDYIWAEMRCRPFEAQQVCDGLPDDGIVAVTRDISDRKRQEEEILRARDEAEGISRAKTQFLANMSHELRTPLNAVIGFSEILNRELFGKLGTERYRDYARLIHESGQHLLNVVNDILDMSKIEAGSFRVLKEPFAVESLLKSCCELMRHAADKKGLAVSCEIAPGLPELVADKRACKQMLLNLLSNAIKFTEEGGWVEVTAKAAEGRMEIAVSDNGIGIAEADLTKLGNPFVQADTSYDRSYEGAGLGLSVVKGLAKLHGGSLKLESELGRGSTVTVTLPIDAGAELQARSALASSNAA